MRPAPLVAPHWRSGRALGCNRGRPAGLRAGRGLRMVPLGEAGGGGSGGPQAQAHLTEHKVFKAHPSCSVCQKFLFYG